MEPHFVSGGTGEVVPLGNIQMRLLLSREQTESSLAAGEFRGPAGPWTIEHLHRALDEFFYVLEGDFTFTCGESEHTAGPGSLVCIPRGTPHVFSAETEGKVLVLWSPGGLEQMFLEFGRLPAGALTDPSVRREISKRYDSVPT
jgi:quercetin dioxygenase-like cupin family protein